MAFEKLDMGIPSQSFYHLPNKADRALRRVQTSAFPTTGNIFSPTGVREVRFNIPQSTAYLDVNSAYVKGKINITNPNANATTVSVQQEGIGCAWQRILVKANGVVLEDLQDANKLYRMIHKLTPVDFSDSIGEMTMLKNGAGAASIAQNVTLTLPFAMPLTHSAVMNSGHFLPLGLMNSFDISLFVNTNVGEVIAEGRVSDCTYTIDNLELQYDEVYMPDEYNQEMLKFLGSGESISLHVNQYKVHLDNLKNSTNNILTISEYVESLKSVFWFFEKATELEVRNLPNVMRDNQIRQFQLKNGSNNYPQLPVDATNKGDVYARLLQASGLLHNVLGGTNTITFDNYIRNVANATTVGVLTQASVAAFKGNLNGDVADYQSTIFGLNTENHTGGLVAGPMSELLTLDLRLAAASSDQVVITTLYDKFITISGTGQIDVRE